MGKSSSYPNIDIEKTGRRIKQMLESAGYSPKTIQEYLQLSCVQPIYRWYKGLILPSVDHLLMLSELLGVHMEELLEKKDNQIVFYNIDHNMRNKPKHLLEYYKVFCQLVG